MDISPLSGEAGVTLPSADIGGAADIDADVGGQVAVEEVIEAEGAKQMESGFGFSMPGLSVSCQILHRLYV